MHQVIFEPGVYQEKEGQRKEKGRRDAAWFFSSSLRKEYFEKRECWKEEEEKVDSWKGEWKRERGKREFYFMQLKFFSLELNSSWERWSNILFPPHVSSFSALVLSPFSFSPREMFVFSPESREQTSCLVYKKESREKKEEKRKTCLRTRWGKIDTKM